jgi:hypothetical protein
MRRFHFITPRPADIFALCRALSPRRRRHARRHFAPRRIPRCRHACREREVNGVAAKCQTSARAARDAYAASGAIAAARAAAAADMRRSEGRCVWQRRSIFVMRKEKRKKKEKEKRGGRCADRPPLLFSPPLFTLSLIFAFAADIDISLFTFAVIIDYASRRRLIFLSFFISLPLPPPPVFLHFHYRFI